jgi:hypothetical protein
MTTRRQKATSANKSEESRQRRSEVGDLHLGPHPGFLHRAIRRALLGGCALRAHWFGGCALRVRCLGGCSASTRRLNNGNTLPCSLGGLFPRPPQRPGLDRGSRQRRGTHERLGSAAADKQRLHHHGAALGSDTGGALGVDAESDDLPLDRRLCRESESGQSEPS